MHARRRLNHRSSAKASAARARNRAPTTTASHAGGRRHPGRDRCLPVELRLDTQDSKPQPRRHARGAARPERAACRRRLTTCVPRGRSRSRRAARQASSRRPRRQRARTSAATTGAHIRPPHREVQRPAAPRFLTTAGGTSGAAPQEPPRRAPAASQVVSERQKKGRTRWQPLRRLGRGE